MKKERFETPEAELILFMNEDVITASGFTPDPDETDIITLE